MSTYQTAAEALSALETRIAGLDWQNSDADQIAIREAIVDIVSQTSTKGNGGDVTVFYSGDINKEDSFDIADAMKDDPKVRVLDETQAFELLSNKDFKNIQAKAFGFDDYRAMDDFLKEAAGVKGIEFKDWTPEQREKYFFS